MFKQLCVVLLNVAALAVALFLTSLALYYLLSDVLLVRPLLSLAS
jgi:hypothetical protein